MRSRARSLAKVDLRGVFLDNPAGNEEGQAQIAARELFDGRGSRSAGRSASGLRRDQIVGGL
jgi:hypothetical protein